MYELDEFTDCNEWDEESGWGLGLRRERVLEFMIEQLEKGETNNGLILGFVLKEMDKWGDDQETLFGVVLAHFRVVREHTLSC